MLTSLRSNVLDIVGRADRFSRRAMRRLAQKNYYTARAHYLHELARLDRQYEEPPILVFQMGRVGSRTVVESLKAVNLDRRIHHFHYLAPDLVDKLEREREEIWFDPHASAPKMLWLSRYVHRRVKRGLDGRKWKIVTLVRDPIARNVSSFFGQIEVEPLQSGQKWKLKSKRYCDFEIVVNGNDVSELIEIFFECFPHDAPLVYFDREFKDVLNIDLYASRFPTSKGYKIYEEEEADVLLIRLGDLNDCATEAFKEFLNIANLTLVNTNVGSRKDYANFYRAFRDSVVFPAIYLDKMYSSKFAQHFYTEAELEAFRARWSKRSAT